AVFVIVVFIFVVFVIVVTSALTPHFFVSILFWEGVGLCWAFPGLSPLTQRTLIPEMLDDVIQFFFARGELISAEATLRFEIVWDIESQPIFCYAECYTLVNSVVVGLEVAFAVKYPTDTSLELFFGARFYFGMSLLEMCRIGIKLAAGSAYA